MERIVFLDRDTVQADFRKPNFPHEWIEYQKTSADEVVERLRDATIAITNKVPIREASVKQLPKLRMVAVAATGTDCVDVQYCRENGIKVSNISNYSVHSVPEHVFMLILALRRNLIAYREDIAAGKWQNSPMFCLLDYPIRDLHDSTLGIIGYGTLGKAVEVIARAFGIKILVAERKNADEIRENRHSFEYVLKNSDIVTLHSPLTAETRGLIGEAELKLMKKDAILINCGRGGLVNEKALADALQNEIIAGAGVDVLSEEPPRSGNPLLDIKLPNLIISPHNAWASQGAMQILADILIDNLESYFENR